MLTFDLLRFQQKSGTLSPSFVDPDNRLLLELAEELITAYDGNVGFTREDLTELVHPILVRHRSQVLVKGLNKLLLDRCTFREREDNEAFRLATLVQASQLMANPTLATLEQYRQTVATTVGEENPDALGEKLYADLPFRHVLESFKPISPAHLLLRYNMALAQGLIVWSEALTIDLEETNAGRLRQFFRYLKFFRLLVRITPLGGARYRIVVDGPLSILQQTQKYGRQLANFLPAVCPLEQWTVTATVRVKERPPAQLELTQADGLVSHYRLTSAYQPEGFTIFAQQFEEEESGWTLLPEPAILDLGGQEIVAPDFSFQDGTGRVVHLELFHRWHQGALLRRLDVLERGKFPLLMGVDRGLAREARIKPRLDQSTWFARHGLLFTEWPLVKRVAKALAEFHDG